jgi:hypothetical protein
LREGISTGDKQGECARVGKASAALQLRRIEEPVPVSGAGSSTFVVCTTPVREGYLTGVALRFQQC